MTPLRVVVLSPVAMKSMREHASDADESEKCGFLFGDLVGRKLCIVHATGATNLYHSKSSFAIGEVEYGTASQQLSPGRRLVGIYHTHRGSADLSCTDRHSIGLRELVWIVMGLRRDALDAEWKCFVRSGHRIARAALRVGLRAHEVDVEHVAASSRRIWSNGPRRGPF